MGQESLRRAGDHQAQMGKTSQPWSLSAKSIGLINEFNRYLLSSCCVQALCLALSKAGVFVPFAAFQV